MSKLRILDSSGDTVLEWTPTQELIADVESAFDTALAEREFRRVKDLGYRTYKVNGPGDAEIVHTFDPHAAEIVASPQTVGG